MYREYDQAGLDAQYNLRLKFPHFQDYFELWDREGRRVRESLRCHLDIPYGESQGERLDFFPASHPGAPVLVFIHGGYWQFLDKSDCSALAEPLVAAGSAVAVVNYALAPSVTVDEIVRQIYESLAWCHHNAKDFGGDPERLYVAGHSAGGHLAAMALTHDWSKVPGVPDDLVKGACAISGVFDLEPIRLTYLNEVLKLDEVSARGNSPLHRIADNGPPLVVAVGTAETEEFLRHSTDFAAAWEKRGNPCTHLELAGLTHFSVLDELASPEGALTGAILAQMGIA